MRIFHVHLGYPNCNVGDQWLAQGLKNLCRDNIGHIEFGERSGALNDIPFIKNEINNKYDILLIGGGGFLGQEGILWQKDPKNLRWLEVLDPKIKVIVYGIGLNLFRGQEDESYFQCAVDNLKNYVIPRTDFFSVRRDGSAIELSKRGLNGIREVYDPCFAITVPEKTKKTEKYILIDTAGDCIENRYGTNCFKFKSHIERITEKLGQKYRIYFIQQTPVDGWVYFWLPYSENIRLLSFQEMQTRGLDWISDAEFVIAMRGHTQISSIALKTPMISISTQEKNVMLMKDLGLERWNVDVHNEDLSTEVLNLIEEMDRTEVIEFYDKRLKEIRESQRKDFEEMKRVLE
jgi:polysaccharide pyruvyl transferase WcaK-like protein